MSYQQWSTASLPAHDAPVEHHPAIGDLHFLQLKAQTGSPLTVREQMLLQLYLKEANLVASKEKKMSLPPDINNFMLDYTPSGGWASAARAGDLLLKQPSISDGSNSFLTLEDLGCVNETHETEETSCALLSDDLKCLLKLRGAKTSEEEHIPGEAVIPIENLTRHLASSVNNLFQPLEELRYPKPQTVQKLETKLAVMACRASFPSRGGFSVLQTKVDEALLNSTKREASPCNMNVVSWDEIKLAKETANLASLKLSPIPSSESKAFSTTDVKASGEQSCDELTLQLNHRGLPSTRGRGIAPRFSKPRSNYEVPPRFRKLYENSSPQISSTETYQDPTQFTDSSAWQEVNIQAGLAKEDSDIDSLLLGPAAVTESEDQRSYSPSDLMLRPAAFTPPSRSPGMPPVFSPAAVVTPPAQGRSSKSPAVTPPAQGRSSSSPAVIPQLSPGTFPAPSPNQQEAGRFSSRVLKTPPYSDLPSHSAITSKSPELAGIASGNRTTPVVPQSPPVAVLTPPLSAALPAGFRGVFSAETALTPEVAAAFWTHYQHLIGHGQLLNALSHIGKQQLHYLQRLEICVLLGEQWRKPQKNMQLLQILTSLSKQQPAETHPFLVPELLKVLMNMVCVQPSLTPIEKIATQRLATLAQYERTAFP